MSHIISFRDLQRLEDQAKAVTGANRVKSRQVASVDPLVELTIVKEGEETRRVAFTPDYSKTDPFLLPPESEWR